MKKYYLAYDERYEKVHNEGLTWFSKVPTPELLEWIDYNNISLDDDICEVGCGEGRDALYLAEKGYKITAIDASEAAIKKCRELANIRQVEVEWKVADALFLKQTEKMKYKWAYSIATLHMLVDDKDRRKFLKALYNILTPGGKLLLVSKGDGETERQSDILTAFELQERNHMETGRSIMVAGTSYRGINWTNHRLELENAGFKIEKAINTENSEYQSCMTVYLTRK